MALPSPASLLALPLAALDHARRWRPVLPAYVIDEALRRDRGGVFPADPDAPRKPVDHSQRAIERTRARMLRTQRLMDPPPRALRREAVELPECTAQWLRLPQSRPGHVLLYFHGGGYIRGATDTHAGALARFMRAARAEALSVDYRLAPEHHFPAWVDDAVDAYRHLLDHGIDPGLIAVGGDSAGGGLALALLQRIRELGLPNPSSAFVVSPWADLGSTGASHRENRNADVMFGPGVIEATATWLVENSGVGARDPLLCPAFGSYPDAPPLRIDVSAREVLRSDAEMVAAAYVRDGSPVQLVEHPTTPHAWTAIGVLGAARRTAREIGAFVNAHFTPAR